MAVDVWTVMWKEWKELAGLRGGLRSSLSRVVITMAVFGLVMPLYADRGWVDTPVSLSLWAVVPPILVSMVVADSFAGERERHTLETLLASRLPDLAVLLGKVGAVVLHSWVITQLVLLVALLPTNAVYLVNGGHGLLLYRPETALSGMVLSLLLAGLLTNVGVLISLRAATLKQAQQVLGLLVFVLAWAVPTIGLYASRLLPEELQSSLRALLARGDVTQIVLLVVAGLVVLDAGLLLMAVARFRRARLIFV